MSESMVGINLALSHFVHSSFRLIWGNESANAWVLCDCKSTIRFNADGEIARLPMLTVNADNQRFFAADHVYFPSFGSMFEPDVILH